MNYLCSLIISLGVSTLAFGGGLEFRETQKSVTADTNGNEVSVDFLFSNRTDRLSTIKGVASGCDCSSSEIIGGKMAYNPGESGAVRLKINVRGIIGSTTKHFRVYTTGDPIETPTAFLSVKISVPDVMILEPKSLLWSIGPKPEPKKIKFLVRDGHEIKIISISERSGRFKCELKELERGRNYEIVVTPFPSSVVPTMGVIELKTDSPNKSYQRINAYAVVK